ncbi:MAG: MFS transporter [Anaerolineales bacterium]|nr:MFS transporter [Anaerolineales bacterium]
MSLHKRVGQVREIYHEYPQHFWALVGARFIDALGGFLLFPFFTLYVTSKFGVGMTEVGLLFGIFSLTNVLGSTAGGALADRLGRRVMVLSGLVLSAIITLMMGLINDLRLFYGVALIVGVFANIGGPASQAMIADLLPEEKRVQGFGIFRVVFNLAATIGPAIGGFLASRSYLSLFIIDAVASTITAVLVYRLIPETKPETSPDQPPESTGQTFRGYARVLRDRRYMFFLIASMLMVSVYMQMSGTLAVYLRDFHGIPEQGFGYILSLNAGMVVLFQFAITRRIEGRPPFLIMAVGTLLYVIGFSMYGLVAVYALFLVAMAIITVGEMLTAPVGQALVAQMAPDDMRGRYMAVYGFSWMIPNALGFYLAGLVIDNLDPRWLWYVAGFIGLIAASAFYFMHLREVAQAKRIPLPATAQEA